VSKVSLAASSSKEIEVVGEYKSCSEIAEEQYMGGTESDALGVTTFVMSLDIISHSQPREEACEAGLVWLKGGYDGLGERVLGLRKIFPEYCGR
jgi:hypothetical protein